MVLPTLATKIGLNEALFLQQLHYWVERSTHEMEGRRWIYNTIEEWCKQFPFWSRRTLTRIISALERQRLILAANYNRKGFDRTKWYTVNYERLFDLESESACSDAVSNESTGGKSGNEIAGDECSFSVPVEGAEKLQENPVENPRMEEKSIGGTSMMSNWHNEETQGFKGNPSSADDNSGTMMMSDWHIPLCQNGIMHDVNLAQPIPENNNREYLQRTTTTARTSQLPMEEPKKSGRIDRLLLSALDYGLQETTIRKYIREFGEDLVAREFDLLKKLIAQKKPIQNPAGWLRCALEQKYVDSKANYENVRENKRMEAEERNRSLKEFYRKQDVERLKRENAELDPSSPFYGFLQRHCHRAKDTGT